ncbi:MAG: glycoside hydrolase family 2, partial [Candidatus Aminicenantes bacterium]|nr:glycoside hydrolase family 2 [Candidatus Aminicenantes bacterium]NIR12370.1 glycoside hydrolase family 2 [Candidatus Aminicenantes bacterium]
MIPEDHLWPIDDYWEYHCARNEFNTLDRYQEALNHRYGTPDTVEEFIEKAQPMNYEAMRAMFEAFGAHKHTTTGIIQWMLNSAWPAM